MIRKRIIPVILLREGRIVQSRKFSRYNVIGDPVPAVERISSWSSDELIYIDITPREGGDDPLGDPHHLDDLIAAVGRKCSVPLTFGGGIRCIADVNRRLRLGADKVTVNTAAMESPELLRQIADEFGSQCLVVSIDSQLVDGDYVVLKGGWEPAGLAPSEMAQQAAEAGAGEILLNSVDRDGTGIGFDLTLIQAVAESVNIPVIALGGAGNWEHFEKVLTNTSVSAVAAANIFHHSENSVHRCKEYLYQRGTPVRRPSQLRVDANIL